MWIDFDEEWSWGMLLRITAKKFDGINPEAVRAYHKYNIWKTVGIAVVEITFKDSLYNGNISMKLFFLRSRYAKVRKRYIVDNNCVNIKNKGYILYADCNITGSNYGTSKVPMLQLTTLF